MDARSIDARVRHEIIFDKFSKIDQGMTLKVVVDQVPDHLLMHMENMGLPIDVCKWWSNFFQNYCLPEQKSGSV
ncbi:DUF2249 domain-containing protein [Oxyplasma meridianum]|uniref:DUF2249 domain-containing protein n=1 Tax=Oxyplasma meridianum TaxID=3073602 RepID=UPI00372D18EB